MLRAAVTSDDGHGREFARRLVGHPIIERVRHPSLPDHPRHARARVQLRAIDVAGPRRPAVKAGEGTRPDPDTEFISKCLDMPNFTL